MKVNIYYGGRGLLDDPTLYVIDKMQSVLEELRVKVDRYNIYEHKRNIPRTRRSNPCGCCHAIRQQLHG